VHWESLKLAELERRLGADWRHLRAASRESERVCQKLREELVGLDSADVSVVVFGSLARGEFTTGSDIDWTLLIDGSADPEHYNQARRAGEIIAGFARPPGAEGTFGNLAFSHEIIHQIGGQDDTNRNTTRRILLLLESRSIGRREAYDRVVTAVLSRYLQEDRGFRRSGKRPHVPRFLLNDFARYWRTMAVDFAYKQRSRLSKGWAIRNIKLRMSRKLLFASGMLSCFACHLDFAGRWAHVRCDKPTASPECVDCLRELLVHPPLEILAMALLHYSPRLDGAARKILQAYDEFTGMLSDEAQRKHLDELPPDQEEDRIFQRARELSHEFRDGLSELFFDEESGLADLTKAYGVF
jgi:hypothetical protein